MTCFVCLRECANKVCTKCGCTAHPICFAEYIYSNTGTSYATDEESFMMKIYMNVDCAICRTNIYKPRCVRRSEMAPMKIWRFYCILNFLNDNRNNVYHVKTYLREIENDMYYILKNEDAKRDIKTVLRILHQKKRTRVTTEKCWYKLFNEQYYE